jgi:uncharacterized protein
VVSKESFLNDGSKRRFIMAHALSIVGDVLVVSFLVWAIARFSKDYRQLKEAVARGDSQARPGFYRRALILEWASALLALVALGFDIGKLTPGFLEMEHSAIGQWLSSLSKEVSGTFLAALVVGIVLGLVIMVVVRLVTKRRGTTRGTNVSSPASGLRKWLPDFGAFIPTTGRERWLFAAVALSAGICEEIVYRGWLLFALNREFALTGSVALLGAAFLFGLAHSYQGPLGVLSASLAGVLMCILYVGTGTLLVPIVLHILIDLRFALLPSGSAPIQQAQPA